MNKLIEMIRIFLIAVFSILWANSMLVAQCPKIIAMMIDACGPENHNEFILVYSGSGFHTNNVSFYIDDRNEPTASDYSINVNNSSCRIASGDRSLIIGKKVLVPSNEFIPANSLWCLFLSSAASTIYDFSEWNKYNLPIYVSKNTCTRTVGAFSNYTSIGIRNSRIEVNNIINCKCEKSIYYDTDSIFDGDGDMWLNGSLFNAKDCIIPSFQIDWCLNNDSLELVKIYNQLDGRNWKNKWDLTKSISTWHGVS